MLKPVWRKKGKTDFNLKWANFCPILDLKAGKSLLIDCLILNVLVCGYLKAIFQPSNEGYYRTANCV